MKNDPLATNHWHKAEEAIRRLDKLQLESETEGEGEADRIVEAITLLANTVLHCSQAVAREIVASREQPTKPPRRRTRNLKQPDEEEQQEDKDPLALRAELMKRLKENPGLWEKLKDNPQVAKELLESLRDES